MKKQKQSSKTTNDEPVFLKDTAALILDTKEHPERFSCPWNIKSFQRCAPGLIEHMPSQVKHYILTEIGTDSETKGMKGLIMGLKYRVSPEAWMCLMEDLRELFVNYR